MAPRPVGLGNQMVGHILPIFQQVAEENEQVIIATVDTLVQHFSLALTCIQAQAVSQSIVTQILWSGLQGHLHIELKTVM